MAVKYEVDRMTTDALWRAIYGQTMTLRFAIENIKPWRNQLDALDRLSELLVAADARRRAPQLPWEELDGRQRPAGLQGS